MNSVEQRYKESQDKRKQAIRNEPRKGIRCLKWIWFLLTFPYVWLWGNLRDWKTWIIFIVVTLAYSGSVWGFYLAALICGWTATTAGQWCIGVGSAVWAWWLSPVGSPFIILCVSTTIGVKALFNKIKDYRKRKKDGQKSL